MSTVYAYSSTGLNLEEYYAAEAMKVLLAKVGQVPGYDAEAAVKDSFVVAKAMVKASGRG